MKSAILFALLISADAEDLVELGNLHVAVKAEAGLPKPLQQGFTMIDDPEGKSDPVKVHFWTSEKLYLSQFGETLVVNGTYSRNVKMGSKVVVFAEPNHQFRVQLDGTNAEMKPLEAAAFESFISSEDSTIELTDGRKFHLSVTAYLSGNGGTDIEGSEFVATSGSAVVRYAKGVIFFRGVEIGKASEKAIINEIRNVYILDGAKYERVGGVFRKM